MTNLLEEYVEPGSLAETKWLLSETERKGALNPMIEDVVAEQERQASFDINLASEYVLPGSLAETRWYLSANSRKCEMNPMIDEANDYVKEQTRNSVRLLLTYEPHRTAEGSDVMLSHRRIPTIPTTEFSRHPAVDA